MRNAIRHIILLFALLYVTAVCNAYYPDITGTVIDAETGQPIEGAVVLVEWTKRVGFGDYHTESVKVVEIITDKEGRFKVSGIADPSVDPPAMTIYKKGYVAWSSRIIFPDKSRDDFRWRNGLVYKLEQFKPEYSYDKHVSFIRGAISSTIAYEKKRKMFEAFDRETDLAFQERMKSKELIK